MSITPDLLLCAVFGLFTLIQLFYDLFFFARLAFYHQKEELPEEARFPVSIIVSAFNEEANLRKNLPLLLEQTYQKNGRRYFEVVVVNDNSEDDTFYLLNQLQEQYPHLHAVNLTQEAKLIPGKKFPLSMGIKSARFEHLLLTDADCIPASTHWLARMASGFSESKKIVLGYSPYNKNKTAVNKYIRFETLHSAIQYLSYALAGMPYMGVGRNLAYRKELFMQVKGFSSHHHIVSGDDDLFINQVATANNTKVVIHEEAFTFSEPKKTFEEWKYQKRRHLSTGKFYKQKHKLSLGLYAMSHFFFWISLIPCFFFYHFIFITAGIFLLRMMVHFFIFYRCCRVLKENDLIKWILYFDLWQLIYNIRNIPYVFFKTHKSWK
ncbi:MAG: glycosyltransferase [Chitinophagaceae bacterium]|nr:glycosyltransferase [Chitinophagaceae bacterium]